MKIYQKQFFSCNLFTSTSVNSSSLFTTFWTSATVNHLSISITCSTVTTVNHSPSFTTFSTTVTQNPSPSLTVFYNHNNPFTLIHNLFYNRHTKWFTLIFNSKSHPHSQPFLQPSHRILHCHSHKSSILIHNLFYNRHAKSLIDNHFYNHYNKPFTLIHNLLYNRHTKSFTTFSTTATLSHSQLSKTRVNSRPAMLTPPLRPVTLPMSIALEQFPSVVCVLKASQATRRWSSSCSSYFWPFPQVFYFSGELHASR